MFLLYKQYMFIVKNKKLEIWNKQKGEGEVLRRNYCGLQGPPPGMFLCGKGVLL